MLVIIAFDDRIMKLFLLTIVMLNAGFLFVMGEPPCISDICTTLHVPRCGGCALDCDRRHLNQVPAGLPAGIQCLYLTSNNISRLSVSDFNHMTHLKEFDASFNQIESIEDEAFRPVGNTLRLLYLHQNKLTRVNKDTFKGLSALNLLYIDHNSITALASGAFDHLPNLTNLQLTDNKLHVGNFDAIPRGLFKSLSNLITLEFQNNYVQGMDQYRGDLVENLTMLVNIRLDGISNGVPFPVEFQQLASLKRMRIYGKEFNVLANETFENLSGLPLEFVSLITTNLSQIATMSFSSLSSLKTLALVHNPNIGLCQLENAWYGLKYTQIERVYFEHIMNPYSNYAFLPCDFFYKLGNTSNQIKEFFLVGNNLVYIDDQIHAMLGNLEKLSLESNRMQQIKTLHCGKEDYSFGNPPGMITCYKYCSNSSDNYGAIPHQDTGQEWGTGTLYLPQTIQQLHLSSAIRYERGTLPELLINNCTHFNTLRLEYNNIRYFKGPVRFSNYLPHYGLSAHLRGNRATRLYPGFLQHVNITAIDLGENYLWEQLEKDINGDVFVNYKTLISLNLSDNEIKTLPRDIFRGLDKLQILNLSQNSLNHFKLDLSHTPDLKILDLKKNMFSVLYPPTLHSFDDHSSSLGGEFHVDLRSNPFVCSCETLHFIKWVLETKTTKHDHYRSYSCFYKSRTTPFGILQDTHLTSLETSCSSETYLIVAVVMFLTTLVVMTIAVHCYRHRWDIKFFIVRRLYKRQWDLFANAERHDFEFHAFVAYHNDDFAWIRNELLAKMEQNTSTPFKLCVHDRDFVPGNSIEENILEGIKSSRKSIMVLSRSFLQSGWCEFELQMARLNCFEKKKNTIIVIILEPIPQDMLTPSLAALIRRTTILEWPYISKNQPQFWEKLRQAITCQELTSLVCECGRSIRNRWSTREAPGVSFSDTMSLN